MSTYIFGDVHGRVDVLEKLLEQIGFSSADRALFVGDLVNVGDSSAQVMRLVRDLGSQAETVLGNHDLHMLAVLVAGQPMRAKDTFGDVLDAPDKLELVDWLLHRPLSVFEDGRLVIHAGLLPAWDVDTVSRLSREVEGHLQSAPSALFKEMYGNEPSVWQDDFEERDRLRIAINTLTRARILHQSGQLEFKFKGEIHDVPEGFVPWFFLTPIKTPIYFGHWSALGLHAHENILALDSGCAWGRELSCVRVEDGRVFQQKVPQ